MADLPIRLERIVNALDDSSFNVESCGSFKEASEARKHLSTLVTPGTFRIVRVFEENIELIEPPTPVRLVVKRGDIFIRRQRTTEEAE